MSSGIREGPKFGEKGQCNSYTFSSAVLLNLLSGIHLNTPSGEVPAHLSMTSLEVIPWPKKDVRPGASGQYFGSSNFCIHRGG